MGEVHFSSRPCKRAHMLHSKARKARRLAPLPPLGSEEPLTDRVFKFYPWWDGTSGFLVLLHVFCTRQHVDLSFLESERIPITYLNAISVVEMVVVQERKMVRI